MDPTCFDDSLFTDDNNNKKWSSILNLLYIPNQTDVTIRIVGRPGSSSNTCVHPGLFYRYQKDLTIGGYALSYSKARLELTCNLLDLLNAPPGKVGFSDISIPLEDIANKAILDEIDNAGYPYVICEALQSHHIEIRPKSIMSVEAAEAAGSFDMEASMIKDSSISSKYFFADELQAARISILTKFLQTAKLIIADSEIRSDLFFVTAGSVISKTNINSPFFTLTSCCIENSSIATIQADVANCRIANCTIGFEQIEETGPNFLLPDQEDYTDNYAGRFDPNDYPHVPVIQFKYTDWIRLLVDQEDFKSYTCSNIQVDDDNYVISCNNEIDVTHTTTRSGLVTFAASFGVLFRTGMAGLNNNFFSVFTHCHFINTTMSSDISPNFDDCFFKNCTLNLPSISTRKIGFTTINGVQYIAFQDTSRPSILQDCDKVSLEFLSARLTLDNSHIETAQSQHSSITVDGTSSITVNTESETENFLGVAFSTIELRGTLNISNLVIESNIYGGFAGHDLGGTLNFDTCKIYCRLSRNSPFNGRSFLNGSALLTIFGYYSSSYEGIDWTIIAPKIQIYDRRIRLESGANIVSDRMELYGVDLATFSPALAAAGGVNFVVEQLIFKKSLIGNQLPSKCNLHGYALSAVKNMEFYESENHSDLRTISTKIKFENSTNYGKLSNITTSTRYRAKNGSETISSTITKGSFEPGSTIGGGMNLNDSGGNVLVLERSSLHMDDSSFSLSPANINGNPTSFFFLSLNNSSVSCRFTSIEISLRTAVNSIINFFPEPGSSDTRVELGSDISLDNSSLGTLPNSPKNRDRVDFKSIKAINGSAIRGGAGYYGQSVKLVVSNMSCSALWAITASVEGLDENNLSTFYPGAARIHTVTMSYVRTAGDYTVDNLDLTNGEIRGGFIVGEVIVLRNVIIYGNVRIHATKNLVLQDVIVTGGTPNLLYSDRYSSVNSPTPRFLQLSN